MTVTVHTAPARLSDAALARWRDLPAALISDAAPPARLIDPAIRPLRPVGTQPFLFGQAVTVRVDPPDFGAMLYVLDEVQPGDVLCVDAGGNAETAMIGMILSGQLRRKGVSGLILDGAVRDVATLADWNDFAVFARHITPRGPTGAEGGVVNAPITLGGALVEPGDLIFGDDDGLVCLPKTFAASGSNLGPVWARGELEAEWEGALEAGDSAASVFGLSPPERS
jgi:4-hydroxy-4-methyl-2-oxoglutarate aldolase